MCYLTVSVDSNVGAVSAHDSDLEPHMRLQPQGWPARLRFSEGLNSAGGFVSKAVHSHSWRISAASWQKASVSHPTDHSLSVLMTPQPRSTKAWFQVIPKKGRQKLQCLSRPLLEVTHHHFTTFYSLEECH